MTVVAMSHAADDGVLVGLLGQQRQQFANDDPFTLVGIGLFSGPQ